jgi:putative peptide zinc metalloprotease protein
MVQQPIDLPGRFVRQGEHLGYVFNPDRPTVRAVVSQADIGLVRNQTHGVGVRLAERLTQPLEATIQRQVPGAVEYLPDRALGPAGGGPFTIDPADDTGLRLSESAFEVELRLAINTKRIGERAFVRFDHGNEPLARQWYRRFRQLFLSRFSI